jgi:hypothetical protein
MSCDVENSGRHAEYVVTEIYRSHRNEIKTSLNITWRIAFDVEQQRTTSVLSHPERTILSHHREALQKVRVTPMVQEILLNKVSCILLQFSKQTNKSRILKNSYMSFCRCPARSGKQTAVAQITMLQSVKNAQPMLVVL